MGDGTVQRTVTDEDLIRLAEQFESATPDLGPVEQYLVRDPEGDEPFKAPYVPFVGSKYRTGGVLVYATAQNIDPKSFPPRYRSRPLWRLYRDGGLNRTGTNYGEVYIQPWKDGILPALVAMWHLARESHQTDDLGEVHQRAAVSNFYKQSLRQGPGQRRDKNPRALSKAEQRSFVEQTLEHYVRPEIERLEPEVVIMFRGPHEREMKGLCKEHRAACKVVNDPSWVKRGMGGVFRPGKSWGRKIEENEASLRPARELVEALLPQCKTPYSAGKMDASRVYLLKYYLDWREEHSSASPGAQR